MRLWPGAGGFQEHSSVSFAESRAQSPLHRAGHSLLYRGNGSVLSIRPGISILCSNTHIPDPAMGRFLENTSISKELSLKSAVLQHFKSRGCTSNERPLLKF